MIDTPWLENVIPVKGLGPVKGWGSKTFRLFFFFLETKKLWFHPGANMWTGCVYCGMWVLFFLPVYFFSPSSTMLNLPSINNSKLPLTRSVPGWGWSRWALRPSSAGWRCPCSLPQTTYHNQLRLFATAPQRTCAEADLLAHLPWHSTVCVMLHTDLMLSYNVNLGTN